MSTNKLLGILVVHAVFLSCAAVSPGESPAKPESEGKGQSKPGAPYYYSSETAPWYDSYGRLRHGYKDTPMKQYPPGKEPYYYGSDNAPWYDSYGRLRHGPQNTETTQPPPGQEPYFHYSDTTPWYDSYGRLRYGPRGLTPEEYERQKESGR